MNDVPYFKPFQEGPLFPGENELLVEDVETFLDALDRDVEDEVARQNRRDMSEDSFKAWTLTELKEMGVIPPKPE